MFPSPNCNNLFPSLLKTRPSISSPSPSSFPFDQNPNLKHDNILFNFPSPFLDEHESPLDQIFYQSHLADHHKVTNPEKLKTDHDQIPTPPPRRRKAGKKDRHSKICTAQGIRDRRMRLSLQVARKFFDLQDMLGYDKASKTIEWLFTQSNKAIKELHSPPLPPPPPLLPNNSDMKSESECEDQSGIEEINSNAVAPTTADRAKASRERARARARCRTREKMMVKRLRLCGNPNPFEGGDEGLNSEIRVSQPEFLGNSEYQCAVSDPSLVGFIGNWDVLSNCFHYSVGNHVSTAGNLSSLFSSPTPEFP